MKRVFIEHIESYLPDERISNDHVEERIRDGGFDQPRIAHTTRDDAGLDLLRRHATAFRICSSTSLALAGIGVPGP